MISQAEGYYWSASKPLHTLQFGIIIIFFIFQLKVKIQLTGNIGLFYTTWTLHLLAAGLTLIFEASAICQPHTCCQLVTLQSISIWHSKVQSTMVFFSAGIYCGYTLQMKKTTEKIDRQWERSRGWMEYKSKTSIDPGHLSICFAKEQKWI